MKKVGVLLAALLLSGCAAKVSMLRSGAVQIEPATGQSYDYRMAIRTAVSEFGDHDKRDTRMRIAESYLGEQCPNLEVVREEEMQVGETFLGNPLMYYYLYVDCGEDNGEE